MSQTNESPGFAAVPLLWVMMLVFRVAMHGVFRVELVQLEVSHFSLGALLI